MVHTTSVNQISRTFQGFFKAKLQFLRTKIYLINTRSPYWLKHVMESFTMFTSSAIVDHIILNYLPQQHFAKWLGMTCNCIWGTEIAFKIKKQKLNIVHAKSVFTLPVSFTGSYTEDETNITWQKNVILQKKVSGIDTVVNFKDFSRTLPEFQDFSDD